MEDARADEKRRQGKKQDDEVELLDAFGRRLDDVDDEDAWEQWYEYVDQVIHGEAFDRTPKIEADEE